MAALRRKIKRTIHSSLTEAIKEIKEISILPQVGIPLFEANPPLFEKYVVKSFSSHSDNRRMPGITDADKSQKISIITSFLSEEIAKLSARISGRKALAVRREMHEAAENIISAYRRLLNTRNN